MKICICRDVKPCSLLEPNQQVRGMCSFHLKVGRRNRERNIKKYVRFEFFHSRDYGEWRLLGSYAVWLL
jgi:hypothetical protein